MKKELIGSLSLDDVPSAGRQGKKGPLFFLSLFLDDFWSTVGAFLDNRGEKSGKLKKLHYYEIYDFS